VQENLNKKIIAIAGNARSGKDTLGRYISEILNEHKISTSLNSFAKALKLEVDPLLKQTVGISAFTENSDEKKIIRDFLVFWGSDFRRKLDQDVWINELKKVHDDKSVLIITDLRFENELKWVKDNNGILLYISRVDENGVVIGPANQYEETNNKILLESSDSSLTWLTSENEALLKSLSNEMLESVLNKEIFELWKATCPL
jgi:hypothetical protein